MKFFPLCLVLIVILSFSLYSQDTNDKKLNDYIKDLIKEGNLFPDLPNYARKNVGLRSEDFTQMPSNAVFIRGLTNFLIARAKAELAQGLFKDMEEWFTTNSLYQDIFGQTHRVIKNISTFSFKEIITSLKVAFLNDLYSLPKNLADTKFLDNLNVILGDELKLTSMDIIALKLGFGILSDIQDGRKPFDILNVRIDKMLELVCEEPVELTKKLSNEILYNIGSKDVKNINYIPLAKSLLLIKACITVILFPDNTLDITINNDWQNYLLEIIRSLHELYVLSHDANAKNKENESKEDIHLQYLKVAVRLTEALFKATFYDKQKVKEIITLASAAITATIDQQYSLAIINLVDFLNFILPDKKTRNKIKNETAREQISDDTLQKMLKYLLVLSSLAATQTPEEVEGVLEAATDPVGSYKTKRSAEGKGYTIALNSYLGIGGGIPDIGANEVEWLWGTNLLPLGIEFSIRICPDWLSLGLFICLIDMGKILDYSIDEFSSITFNTIFTPGAGLVLGISPYPFTIGGLFQRVMVKEGDIGIWRFSLFCSIDLMLIKF